MTFWDGILIGATVTMWLLFVAYMLERKQWRR
jgi:hypothetical protein